MFLNTLVRLTLVAATLVSIGVGIVDYLRNFDQNECSMTYMYEYPRLIPINLNEDSDFVNYKLYLYCEGYFCQKFENLRFTEPGLVPVLFITGNADSHMQVRSLASVSLDKSKTKYLHKKFLYFTISFNEELSALYGPVIEKQTIYARKCIQKILSLFEIISEQNRPKSVLVIGNSMGGIVARNILLPRTDDSFDLNSVNTIITKSSPHNRPVINIDSKMSQIYQDINTYWLNSSENRLKNVVLASLFGGHRDILVRSGLSNIKEWKDNSTAAFISSYTPSIPFVWRSIDHRCMAWCRELVLTVTRALFDLIDSKTGQIYESREIREAVLTKHFDGVQKSSKLKKVKIEGQLFNIEKKTEFFYEFNSYNPKDQKSVLFNLNVIKDDFDSLFIYTNLNEKYSFNLCENIDESECLNPMDLMTEYGQILPPLYENREISLKSINLNNLIELKQKYAFLLIRIPIHTTKVAHQIILKLDWYKKNSRYNYLSKLEDIKLESYPIFSRFYLPSIKNVFQVYNLEKIPLKDSCDLFLQKEINSKKNTLLSSCLMVIFYEQHVGQIENSESIQTKSKNITIKLTKNINNSDLCYFDLIRFDPIHLVKSSKNIGKTNANAYQISFKFNIMGSMGQFIRFYGLFFPSFLTCILQFYDIISLRIKPSISGIFLEHYNRELKNHLYIISILSSLNFLPVYLQTDLELLESENLNSNFLPLLLYLSSYVILLILSLFISVISGFIKLFIKSILLKILPFLTSKNMKIIFRILSLVLFTIAGFYSSTLAICILFYAEFLSILLNESDKLFNQTRLFFMYFLLVLNIPGLIVWAKSITNFSIKPMSLIFEDCALEAAQGFFVIVILNWIKFDGGMMQNFFLNEKIVSLLLFTNSIMTVLYSMINLYRLQYFILAHLLIVSLRPRNKITKNEKTDKKKKD